ncbi:palmitoyl-CoA hydrolase [Ranunculus cassubicifolius]
MAGTEKIDIKTVIEFLGHVPLLQRLPSSSLNKIAQVVIIKHFKKGDYVVREGDKGIGFYFIYDGEAEVGGSFHVEEENRSELQLKRYDYFSHGSVTSVHAADVIALSVLTCLVLPNEYSSLMTPKSIWNADDSYDSLLENILKLEPIEVNVFRGFTLPDAPRFAQVFGGQFIGQALAAASKTVDSLKHVHSLHCYFLLAGDLNMPIVYQVNRLRDGNSFATRRVDATQKGKSVFTLHASFQKEEQGFDHQEVKMPFVPAPEMLLSMEELREKRLTDPRLPSGYRNKVATKIFIPWPVEIKFCEPNNHTNQTKTPPSLKYWFRARGKLSDDQALHRCVVAYISDLMFLTVSLNPHRTRNLKTRSLSLDHSMWFHRTFRADEWLLYVIDSPSSSEARGFVTGRMFNRNGELVASLTQEGLIRKARSML